MTPPSGFTANSHISFIWKMCEDPSSLGLFKSIHDPRSSWTVRVGPPNGALVPEINPESSSLVARLYSILSVILIFLSIGIFCAETLPNVRKYNSCNSHRYHHETKSITTPLVTNQNLCATLPVWARIKMTLTTATIELNHFHTFPAPISELEVDIKMIKHELTVT